MGDGSTVGLSNGYQGPCHERVPGACCDSCTKICLLCSLARSGEWFFHKQRYIHPHFGAYGTCAPCSGMHVYAQVEDFVNRTRALARGGREKRERDFFVHIFIVDY